MIINMGITRVHITCPIGPSVSGRHIFRWVWLAGVSWMAWDFLLCFFFFFLFFLFLICVLQSGSMQTGLEKLRKLLEFLPRAILGCTPQISSLMSLFTVCFPRTWLCVWAASWIACGPTVWRKPITAVGFLPTEAAGSPWSSIFGHKVMVTIRTACWLGKVYSGGARYPPQSQGKACFVPHPHPHDFTSCHCKYVQTSDMARRRWR